MHSTATRTLLRAAATLTTFGAFAAPAGAEACPGATTIPTSEAELAEAAAATSCLVNAERTQRGLPALRRDRDLADAARGHSADMVRRDYFAHTSPTGETFKDRVRAAGYGEPGAGWRAGENLGWGTGPRAAPEELVKAWLESPGHRRILLSSQYRELGIGVAGGAPKKDGSLPGATYTMNVGVTGTR